MSRALDKGVKEALRHGNHERVFEAVSAVLVKTGDELLEVELLGSSHVIDPASSFLQDGNAIAIPRLRLIQAFLVARKNHERHLQTKVELSRGGLAKATAVMLLMDPEHLTAANSRKRLLTNAQHDPETAGKSLQDEKFFVDSLLTSRLHRHTKSPTLWSHRRWLMERFRESGLRIDAPRHLREVVFVSGERHRRNYYAWCHARHLVDWAETDDAAALSTILADTKRWCFTHHDDISGWAFLMLLVSRVPGKAGPVLDETLQLAESFRWRNESVWYFLRNVVSRGPVAARHVDEFRRVCGALHEGVGEGSVERRTLEQAMRWAGPRVVES